MTKILELPKRRGAATRESRIAAETAQRTKRQGKTAGGALVVGAVPSVDLLPTEVHVDRRQRAVVRRAWLAVLVLAIAAATAVVLVSMLAAQADAQLEQARQETGTLLLQQQQFRDVRTIEKQSELLRAAQAVGGSTEVEWQPTLQRIQDLLPSGVTITGVQVDSATPLEAYPQGTSPLQGQRIATLTIDAASTTLPSVPAWLDSLKGIPAFVDANANSVTLDAATNVYTVDMTIHLDEDAFSGEYDLKGKS